MLDEELHEAHLKKKILTDTFKAAGVISITLFYIYVKELIRKQGLNLFSLVLPDGEFLKASFIKQKYDRF